MGGGSPNSGSRDSRDNVREPAGPLAAGRQQGNLESLGRLISEARKDLRDGKVDPELLKSLGMTREQFAAFVEKYTQRIGKVEPMKDSTPRPGGIVRGDFVIPGSDRKQTGTGLDPKLENVRGGEKLTPDEVRTLYEQRAAKVSSEYRKQVEAYFRAISEAAAEK